MVIIRITGGLGNQMFQYAAGRAASLRNKTNLMLNVRFFEETLNKQDHESKVLIDLFPVINKLNLPIINREKLLIIHNRNNQYLINKYNNFRIKLGFRSNYMLFEENDLLTYRKDFHMQDAKILHLTSDWQNEKYFIDHESVIRNDFTFPVLDVSSTNMTVLQEIQMHNSVSVHVRRGDYLSSATHQSISEEFYNKAINLINKRVENAHFFVFSDDINWCQTHLLIPDAHYVNYNTGDNSYIDMQLMSNCKHNIIANSSFSWWGAWLNINKEKIVIAPRIWLEKLNIESNKVIPAEWITL